MVNPNSNISSSSDDDYTTDSSSSVQPTRPVAKPAQAPNRDFQKILEKKGQKKSPLQKYRKLEEKSEVSVDDVADEGEDSKPSLSSLYAKQNANSSDLDSGSDDDTLADGSSFSSKSALNAKSPLNATPSKGLASLTDSADSTGDTSEVSVDDSEAPKVKDSPFNLYKQMTTSTKEDIRNSKKAEAWTVESDISPAARAKAKNELKNKSGNTKLQTEQQDIAFIVPQGTMQQDQGSNTNFAQVPVNLRGGDITIAARIQEIVDQINKEIYTLDNKGSTDTIIDINRPGDIFNNARVVITSFDSAAKEYNLSFENLTPKAKQILDFNMGSLRDDLREKGFATAIHIVTTTTLIEHHIPGENLGQNSKDESQQGRQQREKRKQQYPEEEEA
jgi:hypothetical protein